MGVKEIREGLERAGCGEWTIRHPVVVYKEIGPFFLQNERPRINYSRVEGFS